MGGTSRERIEPNFFALTGYPIVYLLYQQPLNWVNQCYYYLWFIQKHREGEETVFVVDSTRHWLESYPLDANNQSTP